ncbi:4-demethylwyosine synthase TYW1 [Candidatus Woesearchaeota archaeon]|nr:4-demethylwyosine synthase TYW1 [Candidatus Woesearchaeota archaeon]
MDKKYKAILRKQGYDFIGEHSACKTCHYTAKSIRGGEPCYKEKFYGIRSHQCIQMSVALNFCNMNCLFCWRTRNNSPFGKIDDPKELVTNAVESQKRLLAGFGGFKGTDMEKWLQSRHPKHFTLSLNGENTAYPKLDEFIKEIKKNRYTSFLVTNGQIPAVLEKITAPTQMYISLSAPNKELFMKVDKPMLKDGWIRLMKSLDILKKRRKQTRTAIRMTIIKGLTNVHPEQYGTLIKKALPKFVEVKSYSWRGESKKRLKPNNALTMEEVRKFAEAIAKHSGYKIIDEQESGKVVLLMKKDSRNRKMKF